MTAIQVGLFGLLGSGNLGNDVSMETLLAFLRADHPDVVVDAMCKGPERITARYGVPAVAMNWYDRFENVGLSGIAILLHLVGKFIDVFRIAAWVHRKDIVIVPGMGVLEASLPLRPWALPYSLFLLSASGRLLGTKVAFVSVGAGAIKASATRRLLDVAAKHAFYRSYRDAPSLEMMGRRGVDVSNDHVFSDLAFRVPRGSCGPGDPRLVGVVVMDYRGSDVDRRGAAAIKEAYVKTITGFVRWCLDNDRNVCLLVADENEPDKILGQEILAEARAHQQNLEPDRISLHHSSTFGELMCAMAPAGAIVSTRYHGLIAALRLGKPVVSLAYAPKFSALGSIMGLSAFCHLAKSPNLDGLVLQFIELQRRQDGLRASIAAGNTICERSVEAQLAELSGILFDAQVSR
jgi:polysaccharide pyruvyl transferase WcaK-like protein